MRQIPFCRNGSVWILYSLHVILILGQLSNYVEAAVETFEVGSGVTMSGKTTVKNRPGVTLFLGATVPKDSILVSFKAYFLNKSPMYIQVWRPAGAIYQYKLISEIKVTPTVVITAIEEVKLADLRFGICVKVKARDELAVYFPDYDSPLSYEYRSTNDSNRRIFSWNYNTNQHLAGNKVGDTVNFDYVTFPERFAFSGSLYRDDKTDSLIDVDVSCPTSSTTTTTTTTAAAATAAATQSISSNVNNGGNGKSSAGAVIVTATLKALTLLLTSIALFIRSR